MKIMTLIVGVFGGLIFAGVINPLPYDSTLTKEYLCTHSTKERRNVSESLKDTVYAKYKIQDRENYVIDHKINLSIGGNNNFTNLIPQERTEAKKKDLVENYLERKVCRNEISLKEARKQILRWRKVDLSFGGIETPLIFEDEKDE